MQFFRLDNNNDGLIFNKKSVRMIREISKSKGFVGEDLELLLSDFSKSRDAPKLRMRLGGKLGSLKRKK